MLLVLLPLLITVVMAYATLRVLTWTPILIPPTVPVEWVEEYWRDVGR